MLFQVTVAITDLSQHPAHGFVNLILRIVEQLGRQFERVIEVVDADKREPRDDCNTTPPEIAGGGQSFQQRFVSGEQLGADDFVCVRIDQVPVVDVIKILTVEGKYFLL